MSIDMGKAIAVLLIIIGIIHCLPLTGAISVNRLEALYGTTITDSNLALLMRHRAVLFGLLGVFFIYAAFAPSVQPLAFVAAFVSIASFFYFAAAAGEFNAAIKKVVIADVVASVCLLAAVVLYLLKPEP